MLGVQDHNEPLRRFAEPSRASYSGKLEKGTSVMNTVKEKAASASARMLQMHSNSRRRHRRSLRGRHRCSGRPQGNHHGRYALAIAEAVILRAHGIPEPVIRSRSSEDKGRPGKDGLALNRLAAEDPSFRVKTDEDRPDDIAGMGELHLDIIVDRMRREFKVEASVGAPQRPTRDHYAQHEKITRTRSSPVVPASPPLSRSSSNRTRKRRLAFESKIVGGAVSEGIYPRRSEGHRKRLSSGPLAGSRCLGVKATLIDGAFHDVDSSVLAFESLPVHASVSREEGWSSAPRAIMKVEVVTPEDYVGDVLSVT